MATPTKKCIYVETVLTLGVGFTRKHRIPTRLHWVVTLVHFASKSYNAQQRALSPSYFALAVDTNLPLWNYTVWSCVISIPVCRALVPTLSNDCKNVCRYRWSPLQTSTNTLKPMGLRLHERRTTNDQLCCTFFSTFFNLCSREHARHMRHHGQPILITSVKVLANLRFYGKWKVELMRCDDFRHAKVFRNQ